jgi:glycosyltransferase involved in cell wall biosynthesis
LIDVAEGPLRVAFLGRADRVKGVDTLINAVRSASDLQIELHLYGMVQSAGDQGYWRGIQNLAGEDRRITFFPTVEHEDVVPLLQKYHLLAVPSRWLETGPLVVLEAFAAGTPVLGSRLGGLIDWVREGENGILLEPESVAAWADALRRCARDRSFLAHLRRGVRPPRTMEAVADDMAGLYRRHLDSPENLQRAV